VRTVLDSSSLAKRYIDEFGSDDVQEVLSAASELGLCVLCTPEIVSALNRRRREGILTQEEYLQAKALLTADVRDAMVLNLTPAVMSRAIALLETNVLRAIDSLHIACAMEWDADLFVSSDWRQTAAARNAGMNVRVVGSADADTDDGIAR
jgi:hypothetical protein